MKNKIGKIFTFLFLLDFFCLIIFGKSYTKLILFPPFFYLHDLILLMLSIFGIWHIKKENRVSSVEVLFLIAILYLIISFLIIDFTFHKSILTIRQFMLFGYGIYLYIIMNALFSIKDIKKNITKWIIYFGITSIFVQIIYIFYLFTVYSSTVFFDRNYFSPIIVMGFFVTASYILSQTCNIRLKHLLFLILLLVSFSIGHDSVYLSLGLIYFTYLFIISKKKYRIILTLSLFTVIIIIFIFLPSFTDVNAQWRFVFWKDSLIKITNNYFIFGEGFGIPYTSTETVEKLNGLFPDTKYSPLIRGEDIYLTAPHNSFLSMVIHIGIPSLILLIYPIKSLFYNKTLIMDKEILFLSLSLLGIVVFSCFNVILELPHSSSIFWVIFFSLIFKLSEKSESSSSKREF